MLHVDDAITITITIIIVSVVIPKRLNQLPQCGRSGNLGKSGRGKVPERRRPVSGALNPTSFAGPTLVASVGIATTLEQSIAKALSIPQSIIVSTVTTCTLDGHSLVLYRKGNFDTILG
jgi:hypothetical protein